jgi:hypothetical protein
MPRARSAERRHLRLSVEDLLPRKAETFASLRLRRGEGIIPRSRGALRPGFASASPRKGGCRECRVRSAPAASCANSTKNAHEKNRYRQSNPAFPAQGENNDACGVVERRMESLTH